MNTGLQDAHNLACKLADVLRRGAPDASLDRYAAERMPVARRLVGTTDTLFGFVTSDRRGPRFLRRRVLRVLAPVAAALVPRAKGSSRLFGYLSQTRIHYWMSERTRVTSHGRRSRVVGRRLPWNGDNYEALRSMQWQVHVYGAADDAEIERLSAQLDMPVLRFPHLQNDLLHSGLCCLVRPDGFVAAAGPLAGASPAIARALPFAHAAR
jgi:hypothetical protein